MATCRTVINGALRKLGRLGAGREPRTADQTDALAALQGLYSSWVAAGAFGRLADVIPLVDYTAGVNQRIIRDPEVVTVTLPEFMPMYGDPMTYGEERPCDGYGREHVPPRDGSVVQIMDTNGQQTETWIYDAALRVWTDIGLLQLDNEAPRSASDPEGLSAALALELADTFGADVGPTTVRQATRYQTAMTHRYGMRAEAAAGVYF